MMTAMMLRPSLRAICRWTSALLPTRAALLSGDCVAGHQRGPWETASSERALIHHHVPVREIGVKNPLISVQRVILSPS